jgi:carbohydrate esterase-like sialic acid-specific acetylesterase
MKKLLALALVLLAGSALAGPRGRVVSKPDPFVIGVAERGDVVNEDNGNADISGKTVRSRTINTGIKNLVLLVFGQSNCTSIAATAFTPVNGTVLDNFNILDGQMYAASDPLLGQSIATPTGTFGPGGIAIRVGDTLITNGKFDRVILVTFCIGGTGVATWSYPIATGQPLGNNPTAAMARLAQAGITPGMTGVTFAAIWMQGESDHGTSQVAYTNAFATISTQLFATPFNGRLFINKQTWLSGAVDTNVQNAQIAIPNSTTPGTWAGANADSLGAGSRQADNTHFTAAGLASLSTLIVAAMNASGAPF